jgi:hypothetical protein
MNKETPAAVYANIDLYIIELLNYIFNNDKSQVIRTRNQIEPARRDG